MSSTLNGSSPTAVATASRALTQLSDVTGRGLDTIMNYDQGDLLAELRMPEAIANLREAPSEVLRKARADRAHEPAKSGTPRCRMCSRPARFVAERDAYAAYCHGSHCSNDERLCQQCGRSFTRNVGEAGTKYCSTACKVVGYHPETKRPSCIECGKRMDQHRDKLWPPVCETCRDPLRYVINALRTHHVGWGHARRLITDPGCDVCGVDIVSRAVAVPGLGYGQRAAIHVDHDHACCPGSYSCGRCVRGFLCAKCNHAVGLLRDDPALAREVARYLETHRGTSLAGGDAA